MMQNTAFSLGSHLFSNKSLITLNFGLRLGSQISRDFFHTANQLPEDHIIGLIVIDPSLVHIFCSGQGQMNCTL